MDKIYPTFGFNIDSANYDGFKVNIWDVGGQKAIRSYWRNYYEKTNGFIWVVDSFDMERLLESRETLYELLKFEQQEGFPVLILVNKMDLPQINTRKYIEDVLGVEEIRRNNRECKIFFCSSVDKSDSNIEEGFNWMLSTMEKIYYYYL